MQKAIFSLALLVALNTITFSQVGIGTTTPDKSAVLELNSTSKGFLLPRMTAEQKASIAAPIKGLLIYQINGAIGLYSYNGSAWVAVAATGGVGNFVDLTTDQGINGIKTFNTDIYASGLLVGKGGGAIATNTVMGSDALNKNSTGYENTAIGLHALYSNTTGYMNTAVGDSSMHYNEYGWSNTAFGTKTLMKNVSGKHNSAFGNFSLSSNTTGNHNEAFGNFTLSKNTTGSYNTALGDAALLQNTEGVYNVATGPFALQANVFGNYNVAVGNEALFSNTIGLENTAIGNQSLHNSTLGLHNTSVGALSLFENTYGNSNSVLGYEALYSNTKGNSNIAIGTGALYSNTLISNLVAIGDSALYYNGVSATGKTEATNNTAVGSKALFNNSRGYNNTATGSQSLSSNLTGNFNTANGYLSLADNTIGHYNTGVGALSLSSNVNGNYNSAFGTQALFSNYSGSNNTANGFQALFNNYKGGYNTATGFGALYFNENGDYNTANGYQALLHNLGNNNTATGVQTLLSNSTGINNTANGLQALYNNTIGNNNTAFGYSTLTANISGSNNTAIGYLAGVSTGINNATVVGANAQAACSNCVVLGSINGLNGATSNTAVGIGTNVPKARLHVNPLGSGGILIGGDAPNGYTTLALGISAATGGSGYVQSQMVNGSAYGSLLLNPNGGNIGINYASGSAVNFPIDINQKSDSYGLRFANSLSGYSHNWDLFANKGGAFIFSYNGVEKSWIDPDNGDYIEVSDARLKKNINSMNSVLSKVIALQPKTYQYVSNKQDSKLSSGFLAQEVMQLFPELVRDFKHPKKDSTDDKVYHGISYAGFGVIAIKAIQEQQQQIESANEQNKMMLVKIAKLEAAIEELNKRMR